MLYRSRAAVVFVLAALYLLAMFLATHVPLDIKAPAPGVSHADKLVHAAMFAGLAVLVLAAASFGRPVSLGVALVLVLLIAVYAALDEWTQQFIPNRHSDPRDWIADVFGASVGAAVFLIGRNLWRSATPASV